MDCELYPHATKNVKRLKQQPGWQVTSFDIPSIWLKNKGKGVVIGVLDTGVDMIHYDLERNLLNGHNFVDENKPPIDDNGHGTHITGIICAGKNKSGIVGIAPEAMVLPVKVLDENGLFAVDRGMAWLACASPIAISTIQ